MADPTRKDSFPQHGIYNSAFPIARSENQSRCHIMLKVLSIKGIYLPKKATFMWSRAKTSLMPLSFSPCPATTDASSTETNSPSFGKPENKLWDYHQTDLPGNREGINTLKESDGFIHVKLHFPKHIIDPLFSSNEDLKWGLQSSRWWDRHSTAWSRSISTDDNRWGPLNRSGHDYRWKFPTLVIEEWWTSWSFCRKQTQFECSTLRACLNYGVNALNAVVTCRPQMVTPFPHLVNDVCCSFWRCRRCQASMPENSFRCYSLVVTGIQGNIVIIRY